MFGRDLDLIRTDEIKQDVGHEMGHTQRRTTVATRVGRLGARLYAARWAGISAGVMMCATDIRASRFVSGLAGSGEPEPVRVDHE